MLTGDELAVCDYLDCAAVAVGVEVIRNRGCESSTAVSRFRSVSDCFCCAVSRVVNVEMKRRAFVTSGDGAAPAALNGAAAIAFDSAARHSVIAAFNFAIA